MGRIEENGRMLDKLKKTFHGSPKEVSTEVQGQMLVTMADMSKSLASIAETAELERELEETRNKLRFLEAEAIESETYVRDHMLIEWMMNHSIFVSHHEVETVYRKWKEWEANCNGKRSEV